VGEVWLQGGVAPQVCTATPNSSVFRQDSAQMSTHRRRFVTLPPHTCTKHKLTWQAVLGGCPTNVGVVNVAMAVGQKIVRFGTEA